jgi:hypothetical protein
MCSGGASSDLYTVNQSNPPIIELFFEQARFKKAVWIADCGLFWRHRDFGSTLAVGRL